MTKNKILGLCAALATSLVSITPVSAQIDSDTTVIFHYEPTVIVHDAFSNQVKRILRGKEVKRGDVNGDGKVDLADLTTLASRLYSGNVKETVKITPICARVIGESAEYQSFEGTLGDTPGVLKFTTDMGDCNADGQTDTADLQVLMDALNGKVSLLPMKCDLSPIEG